MEKTFKSLSNRRLRQKLIQCPSGSAWSCLTYWGWVSVVPLSFKGVQIYSSPFLSTRKFLNSGRSWRKPPLKQITPSFCPPRTFPIFLTLLFCSAWDLCPKHFCRYTRKKRNSLYWPEAEVVSDLSLRDLLSNELVSHKKLRIPDLAQRLNELQLLI